MGDPGLTRRRVLGLGTAAAVTGLAGGCSGGVPGLGGVGSDPGRESASCVPRSALTPRRDLAGLPLVYEPDGRRSAFWFDAAFADRLEAWVAGLAEVLPQRPTTLTTYGSWIDGRGSCDSWHHAGRAFDLARVRLADGSEVSCRYDRWRTLTGTDLERAQRAYWALAAGLHARFSYVLTYLYDGAHANHVHVDNGRSGDGDPTFRSGSRVQVQAVQAICRHLWEEPVELTGAWDGPTRRSVGRLLERLGLDDTLSSTGTWQAWLTASAARGRE